MLAESISLPPAALLEVVFVSLSAFGVLLVWPLPRYRGLAYYLIYQVVLMSLNLYEAGSTHLLITPVFTLIKGPLLYLFIRTVVNEKPFRRVSLYAQFLPPVVLVLFGATVQLAILLGAVSQILYLSLSFRLLHRYHRAARAFRSDAGTLDLTWLVVAYWMIAAQAVIGLTRLVLQPALNQEILRDWFLFDLVFLLGVCCFLVFKAVRQPPLYDSMLVYESAGRSSSRKDSGSDADEARSVFARLDALIAERELYKRPRLSVDDLAKETGMQMKDISWAFNVGAKSGFNEYINRLRVNALKRRLQDSDAGEASLLEMALETGFNSKSSFNAAFKREVGMTPSQFVRSGSRADASQRPRLDTPGVQVES